MNFLSWRLITVLTMAGGLTLSGSAQAVKLMSLTDPGQSAVAGGGGDSTLPMISSDGRFVLFASTANNLTLNSSSNPIPLLIPPALNVFLRDRASNTTMLVSFNLSQTGGGNGDSVPTGLSEDGRYALFESDASDLVPGDTNNATDIFVRDLVAHTTRLVSASTNGFFANGPSRGSSMTPDGRYVAFVSTSSDLVFGDTNRIADVFVRDLKLGMTTLASVGAKPTNPNLLVGRSESADITPDGRYVCFYSSATNLVQGVRSAGEIYIRDLVTGTTHWASAHARNAALGALRTTNVVCYNQVISDDGQFVAYQASAADVGFTNSLILRYDRLSSTTEVISSNAFYGSTAYEDVHSLDMTPDGQVIAYIARTERAGLVNTCVRVWNSITRETTLASGALDGSLPTNSIADSPMLDQTGRFVAFLSNATNLVSDPVSFGFHVYLRDLQSRTTQCLDANNHGAAGSINPTVVPRLSSDARFVAFECADGSLVANDQNRHYDVFLRDNVNDRVEVISSRDSSLPCLAPNGSSTLSQRCLSSDGRFLAFTSAADNFGGDDTNGFRDVFVRDLGSGTNTLVSSDSKGLAGNGVSSEPAINADGRYVAFTSSADNLVAGDTNKAPDVFIRDLQSGVTALVSLGLDGVSPGNRESYSPVVSADGRFVLFRSKALNLASGNFRSTENLFLRDLQLQTTYPLTQTGLVSVAATPDLRFVAFTDFGGTGTLYLWDTQQASLVYTNSGVGISVEAISPDGLKLIFRAGSGTYSLFVAERTAPTSMSRVIAFGTSPNTRPAPRFSRDGRFFAYCWNPGGTNLDQIYLYDFPAGKNLLISRDYYSGLEGNGVSDSPDISADGRFLAYRSAATNLIPGDANGVPDIFVYDQVSGLTLLASTSRFGQTTADNRSLTPVFSSDGKTLFFESWASDLSPGSYNRGANVFALDISTSVLPVFFVRMVMEMVPRHPRLVWPIAQGKTYRVEYKRNLNETNWEEIHTPPTITGNQAEFEDLDSEELQRFYRVVAY